MFLDRRRIVLSRRRPKSGEYETEVSEGTGIYRLRGVVCGRVLSPSRGFRGYEEGPDMETKTTRSYLVRNERVTGKI